MFQDMRKVLITFLAALVLLVLVAPFCPADANALDSAKERFRAFDVITLIGAGLLDGFNPCAFATVVFFVSFLAFAGLQRRAILVAGVFYIATVFITYLLLGLGVFNAIRQFSFYGKMDRIIPYAISAMSFIFAMLSLHDLFLYVKTRKSSGMFLQLPLSLKQKIHAVIRNNLKARGLVLGAAAIGFLVTLFEAVCTGQIYLPTILMVLKDPELKAHAFMYLVLYNTMFILPLVVVFLLVYFGISSREMESFAQRNAVLNKLLISILFIALGIILLVI
ncbi:MAG: hypothetical protein HY811_00485 [Planctomycetes bacterium]|nr:hypothetical protein [Planctomycetota bacterium]